MAISSSRAGRSLLRSLETDAFACVLVNTCQKQQESAAFGRLRARAPWDLRRLSLKDWLLGMSEELLSYLPQVEQCYDTVAQIHQTYRAADGKLDPLIYTDLGILEPHRWG